MNAGQGEKGEPLSPVIYYAPLGEIRIYLLREDELNRLAAGSAESIYLNFALFLLPIALTLFLTLLTLPIASTRIYLTFVTLCAVTLIAGLVLLVLWWRNRRNTEQLLREIKRRMPPTPGIQQSGSISAEPQ